MLRYIVVLVSTRAISLMALACTLALAACGSSSDSPTTPSAAAPASTTAPPATTTTTTSSDVTLLDTKHVEQAIVRSVEAQRKVTPHVSCPRTVPQEKGIIFHCTASSSVGKATFVVTQTDGHGHVTYVAR
jgi:hypothetical protein